MHVHEICKTGGTLGAPFGFSTGAVNGPFVPCLMDREKHRNAWDKPAQRAARKWNRSRQQSVDPTLEGGGMLTLP